MRGSVKHTDNISSSLRGRGPPWKNATATSHEIAFRISYRRIATASVTCWSLLHIIIIIVIIVIMADVAVDVDAVHVIVRQAVQGIDVDKEGQTLFIKPDAEEQQRPITLTDRDVQYFVTFLQNNPRAVIKLDFTLFSLTLQAVEILRSYFASPAMSLNHIRFDQMELGNVNGGRLLSSR
jgi:hypothetical protein